LNWLKFPCAALSLIALRLRYSRFLEGDAAGWRNRIRFIARNHLPIPL
jgi:hypothetical protein